LEKTAFCFLFFHSLFRHRIQNIYLYDFSVLNRQRVQKDKCVKSDRAETGYFIFTKTDKQKPFHFYKNIFTELGVRE